MTVTGAATLAGIAGWPVSQSLSPVLHGHWLAEHGIDGAYVPLAIRPEDFARVLDGLRRCGFAGLNVTIPHKEAAFAVAARLDDAAQAIGAVNLLLIGDKGLEGRNTDAYGLMAALTEALGTAALKDRSVAIWGAGGTARAAIYALCRLGVAEIHIFNRTASRAEALAKAFIPVVAPRLHGHGYDAWAAAAPQTALVVHTTSAGMKGAPALELALDGLPADAAVFDAVYNPLETPLLAKARTHGLKTVDGLWMLIHQAVPSFEALFGVRPQVTPELRQELERALARG
jgi:shikimate dehydrogenase